VLELIFVSRSGPRDNIAALACNKYGSDVNIRLVLRFEFGIGKEIKVSPIKASVWSLGGEPGVMNWLSQVLRL
jgi:hypothetical protein